MRKWRDQVEGLGEGETGGEAEAHYRRALSKRRRVAWRGGPDTHGNVSRVNVFNSLPSNALKRPIAKHSSFSPDRVNI